MNAFIDKLERRFGHLAIEDLTKKLVILKVLVFLCIQFVFNGEPSRYSEALSTLQVANTYIIGDLIAALCTPKVLTSNGLNLVWSTGEVSNQITVTQSGTYSVVITDILGCSITRSITIN